MQKLATGIIIILLFGINSAHAEQFQFKLTVTPGDAFWSFGKTLEKIHEDFTFDPTAKKELILKHAMQRQAEIEQCSNCNSNEITILQQAREEQLAKAEAINLTNESPMDVLISKIRQASELDDIQTALADFRSGNYQRDELEARVNSLESVQKNCERRIMISELEENKNEAYKKLQEICPVLRTMSATDALSRLGS